MQLPNLGGLALRPCKVPTGAGEGKKQKTDKAERDLQDLWRRIIAKVQEYAAQGGGAFFRALVEELNRRVPGLIPEPSRVDFNALKEGATSQEKQKLAKELIEAVYKELRKKRRREDLPVLGPPKVQKRPAADQATMRRNAQQSRHMETDREDDAAGHFRNAQNFVDPPPWPSGPATTEELERRGDLRRKSPEELAELVSRRDPDGGRCCAMDQ